MGRNVVRIAVRSSSRLKGLNAKANQIVRNTTQPDPRIRLVIDERCRPNSRALKDS